jgi:hypothetical protein
VVLRNCPTTMVTIIWAGSSPLPGKGGKTEWKDGATWRSQAMQTLKAQEPVPALPHRGRVLLGSQELRTIFKTNSPF